MAYDSNSATTMWSVSSSSSSDDDNNVDFSYTNVTTSMASPTYSYSYSSATLMFLGNSGVIFLSKYKDNHVLLKCFKKQNGKRYFDNERKILEYISKYCPSTICLKYYGHINIHDTDVDLQKLAPFELYEKCLVLEYLDHKDGWYPISDIVKNKKQISSQVITNLYYVVIYLHNTLGIVHNDLTPYNIMVNIKSSKVVLIDYGLSCFIKTTCRENKGWMGMHSDSNISPGKTIKYISEKLYGRETKSYPDIKKDLYTINIVVNLLIPYVTVAMS